MDTYRPTDLQKPHNFSLKDVGEGGVVKENHIRSRCYQVTHINICSGSSKRLADLVAPLTSPYVPKWSQFHEGFWKI